MEGKRKNNFFSPKIYYAVKYGFNPGVYGSWMECQAQIVGFPCSVIQKFTTFAAAKAFVQSSLACPEDPPKKLSEVTYDHLIASYETQVAELLVESNDEETVNFFKVLGKRKEHPEWTEGDPMEFQYDYSGYTYYYCDPESEYVY